LRFDVLNQFKGRSLTQPIQFDEGWIRILDAPFQSSILSVRNKKSGISGLIGFGCIQVQEATQFVSAPVRDAEQAICRLQTGEALLAVYQITSKRGVGSDAGP
jgi:hypothetical protein